jgi:hypothetical protein
MAEMTMFSNMSFRMAGPRRFPAAAPLLDLAQSRGDLSDVAG